MDQELSPCLRVRWLPIQGRLTYVATSIITGEDPRLDDEFEFLEAFKSSKEKDDTDGGESGRSSCDWLQKRSSSNGIILMMVGISLAIFYFSSNIALA